MVIQIVAAHSDFVPLANFIAINFSAIKLFVYF